MIFFMHPQLCGSCEARLVAIRGFAENTSRTILREGQLQVAFGKGGTMYSPWKGKGPAVEVAANAGRLEYGREGKGHAGVFALSGSHVLAWWKDGVWRVYDMDAGAKLCADFNARKGKEDGDAAVVDNGVSFFSLGGSVVGVADNKSLTTWDALSGEQLGAVELEGRVGRFRRRECALGDDRFVLLSQGELLFLRHSRGSSIELQRRTTLGPSFTPKPRLRPHGDCVLAWKENGEQAAIWGPDSDEPLARFDVPKTEKCALCSKFVVLVDVKAVLHIFKPDGEFVSRLDFPYIGAIAFVGNDLLVTVSAVRNEAWFTEFTSTQPKTVTRVHVDRKLLPKLLIMGGRVVVCSDSVHATLDYFDAPACVADRFRAHAHALSNTLTPLQNAVVSVSTPLHDAVTCVMDGSLELEEACRDLLTAENCARSLREWVCAHNLLMWAVDCGQVAGDTQFEGDVCHWFSCVYLPVHGLVRREEDLLGVKVLCSQAVDAGVLEGLEGVLAAVILSSDLASEVESLRGAGQQLMFAVSEVIFRQCRIDTDLCRMDANWRSVDSDLRNVHADLRRLNGNVCDIRAQMAHAQKVQKWSLICSAVFSFIPLGSELVAGAAVTALSLAENIPEVVEKFMATVAGVQGSVAPALLEKFLSRAKVMVSLDEWERAPLELRREVEGAVEQLGMSWDEFYVIITTALTKREHAKKMGEETWDAGMDDRPGYADGYDDAPADNSIAGCEHERESGPKEMEGGTEGGAEGGGGGSAASTTAGEMDALSPAELENFSCRPNAVKALRKVKDVARLLSWAMVDFNDEFENQRRCLETSLKKLFQLNCISGKQLVGIFAAGETKERVIEALRVDERYMKMDGRLTCERHLISFVHSVCAANGLRDSGEDVSGMSDARDTRTVAFPLGVSFSSSAVEDGVSHSERGNAGSRGRGITASQIHDVVAQEIAETPGNSSETTRWREWDNSTPEQCKEKQMTPLKTSPRTTSSDVNVAGGSSEVPYKIGDVLLMGLGERARIAHKPDAVKAMDLRDLALLLASSMVGFEEEFDDKVSFLQGLVRTVLSDNFMSAKALFRLCSAEEMQVTLVDALREEERYQTLKGTRMLESNLLDFLQLLRPNRLRVSLTWKGNQVHERPESRCLLECQANRLRRCSSEGNGCTLFRWHAGHGAGGVDASVARRATARVRGPR